MSEDINYNEITNIEELFEKWKERHKERPDRYNQEETGIAVDSFTNDGVVNEKGWRDATIKVLYILREANGSYFIQNGTEPYVKIDGEGENFWFAKSVQEASKNNIELNGPIFKKIKLMQSHIEDKMPNNELLKHVAYMNLNKRGGGSNVNWNILKEYSKAFKEEIKKEISLINPDIIVCCGTYWLILDQVYQAFCKDKWNENNNTSCKITINEKDVKIINIWHPSCRKSENVYIDTFKKNYNGNNENNRPSILDIKDRINEIVNSIDDRGQLEELLDYLEDGSNKLK